MTAIWIIAGLAGLFWSLLCWLLWAAAGAGGSAVLAMARILQIDPLNIVWLADTLDAVGSVAQVLVAIFWAIGLGLTLLVAWMAGKGARAAQTAITEARMAAGDPAAGHIPALEGEIRARSVEPPQDRTGTFKP